MIKKAFEKHPFLASFAVFAGTYIIISGASLLMGYWMLSPAECSPDMSDCEPISLSAVIIWQFVPLIGIVVAAALAGSLLYRYHIKKP
jgi:hypothetical protein